MPTSLGYNVHINDPIAKYSYLIFIITSAFASQVVSARPVPKLGKRGQRSLARSNRTRSTVLTCKRSPVRRMNITLGSSGLQSAVNFRTQTSRRAMEEETSGLLKLCAVGDGGRGGERNCLI